MDGEPGTSPRVRLGALEGRRGRGEEGRRGGRGTGNGQGLGLRENKAWAHKGLQRLGAKWEEL
jgi:hypothetical protein